MFSCCIDINLSTSFTQLSQEDLVPSLTFFWGGLISGISHFKSFAIKEKYSFFRTFTTGCMNHDSISFFALLAPFYFYFYKIQKRLFTVHVKCFRSNQNNDQNLFFMVKSLFKLCNKFVTLI